MNKIVVQKYGGTSIGDVEKLKSIAKKVSDKKEAGFFPIVVVSAMGKSTDELVRMSEEVTFNKKSPDLREKDTLLSTGELVSSTLLAISIKSLDKKVISLSGSQAGITTDDIHGSARISDINTSRILQEIKEDKIIIIAGFQGVNIDGDITTLGRGGSDTTAVALAAALNADVCEIYTDVEGIYTTDPRIVSNAKKLDKINYEDMLEMAVLGAKMHPRSIELASIYDVPVYVAGTFSKETGTLITKGVNMEKTKTVTGIAIDKNVSKITIKKIKNLPGTAASILKPLSDNSISIDVIVQNTPSDGFIDFSFSLSQEDLEKAYEILNNNNTLDFEEVVKGEDFAKVSLVGTGMQNAPGYATEMFNALGEKNISIDMITTSEIRITCLINQNDLDIAVNSLHETFELDK
ncbi:MAG: aspartate kinase [SAR202 cluster bacterium]|jgi:aspartate kinase|nr:MAG: aspartate kinase [SAR202 cluster bacterium]KAA1299820.1 MAG: aspartate kinase [SAR202 cluster bacterium]MQG12386.1 aspartate kinase [SAR202 cluster bacterium]|tara:strand:+ start:1789 stop:3009 length:1221 start_codon:yes stop_codon:yes gene_type:complete